MEGRGRRAAAMAARAGLPPGRAVFIGRQKVDSTTIDVMSYDADSFTEEKECSLERALALSDTPKITWINITGIHDTDLIDSIGERFGLHPLTCEDIVNTDQRPKLEEFPGYMFIVLKMMTYHEGRRDIDVEHVSLLLGKGWVLSFQERPGDVFDPVRERLRSSVGRIRKHGADYLTYALMDMVVDNYFVAIEGIGEYIETIDEEIMADPSPSHMNEIHRLKRCMLTLRKAVWPLREEIGSMEKNQSELIAEDTGTFLRNLYDHTIQVIDMVETHRDLLAGMHDTYLTRVSNRMNDIMKVLTIIATIFIPLTFIAGVYGMNFRHMPELSEPWAYPAVLLLMLLVAALMVWFFKRKKWF